MTNSGSSLTVEHTTQSGATSIDHGFLHGAFSSGPGGAEGWTEFVGSELHGFYSDTWGNIYDPYGRPPGDDPPVIINGDSMLIDREMQSLLSEVAKSGSNYLPNSYLGCVGSVAGAIGATIFGAQQHSSNVQGYRAGQLGRGAVRASGVALATVVVGGAAVSAAVCTQVFFKK